MLLVSISSFKLSIYFLPHSSKSEQLQDYRLVIQRIERIGELSRLIQGFVLHSLQPRWKTCWLLAENHRVRGFWVDSIFTFILSSSPFISRVVLYSPFQPLIETTYSAGSGIPGSSGSALAIACIGKQDYAPLRFIATSTLGNAVYQKGTGGDGVVADNRCWHSHNWNSYPQPGDLAYPTSDIVPDT